MLVFKESKVKKWLTNSCTLSGPIETKCLMYVNARCMVIDIHKTFGFNRKNLSLRGRAS